MTNKSLPLYRNLLLCALVGWLGVYASLLSTLSDRLAAQFSLAGTDAGLFISAHALGMLVSVLLSGSLADSIGKRRIVLVGCALMVAGLIFTYLAQSLPAILAGLFLTGMGFSPSEAISSALLTDENPEHATRWMNWSQVCFGLGAVLSPLAVVWYLSAGRAYGGLLLICAGLVGVSGLLILLAGGDMGAGKADKTRLNMFSVLKSKTVLVCCLMVFFYLGVESVGIVYLKQLFLLHGEGSSLGDLSISLFWLAMIVLRLVGTRMDGREMISLRYLTLMIPLGAVVSLLAPNPGLRLLGAVLYGAGCGAVWPMLFVLAGRSMPQRSGAVFAMMMIFTTAGNSLFPMLIGKWVANPETTMIICAALALLLPALSFSLERSIPSPRGLAS
ncbi:MAG: MFS transporter [Eubacteriales bacterium]|nr:MFS transporter [Eubacteriales bacterium]